LYCFCHDHPLESVSVKCQAPLVEVEDCRHDTQRPRHVCCIETKVLVNNPTVADWISKNGTDDKRRIENINERPIPGRNATVILHKQLMDKAENIISEDNDRLLQSNDQMTTSALESNIRVEQLRKPQNKHVIETQSNTDGNNKQKGNVKSRNEKELAKKHEQMMKRRKNKRRRQRKQQLLRNITEKVAENML